MFVKIIVRKNEYRDSVFLMVIRDLVMKSVQQISDAAILIGTPNNKDLFREAGFTDMAVDTASPNDIMIGLASPNEAALEQATQVVIQALDRGTSSNTNQDVYKTMESALRDHPQINFAIISVPGAYAARETIKALNRGLNVLLFSDNVSLDEEVEIKQHADKLGKIVMGPDCGTAIINGVPLAFANRVRRGPVGIVAASGTGLQELSVLIDRAGYGVSKAIGTGGRDLSNAVGGISTLKGLDILEKDPMTRVIVVASKPPQDRAMQAVIARTKTINKPVVFCFLGIDPPSIGSNVQSVARTIDEAAGLVIAALTGQAYLQRPFSLTDEEIEQLVIRETYGMAPLQRYVRGLYSGGTLCDEAMLILEDHLGAIYSNTPIDSAYKLGTNSLSLEHTCIDLGSDELTRGVPHPMISPTSRKRFIEREAADPEVAILLLDVVLGYGSHMDMAGELKEAIHDAKLEGRGRGGYLSVIASVCGTENDPQSFNNQKKTLEDAGVVVMPDNAQAARLAALIAQSRIGK